MTTVASFTCNPFQTNCFVAHSEGEAVLVDGSSFEPEEHEAIVRYLDRNQLRLRHLFLTHTHLDHLYGCAFFEQRYGLPWKMHPEAIPLLERANEQAQILYAPPVTVPSVETTLAEGDAVCFGSAAWNVLHTPGHAPGSVCFVDAESEFVMVGDVLFMDSIGRTDLPGGSLPVLMRSIFEKLMSLPDNTAVYAGHGPATTIGRERKRNPFLI